MRPSEFVVEHPSASPDQNCEIIVKVRLYDPQFVVLRKRTLSECVIRISERIARAREPARSLLTYRQESCESARYKVADNKQARGDTSKEQLARPDHSLVLHSDRYNRTHVRGANEANAGVVRGAGSEAITRANVHRLPRAAPGGVEYRYAHSKGCRIERARRVSRVPILTIAERTCPSLPGMRRTILASGHLPRGRGREEHNTTSPSWGRFAARDGDRRQPLSDVRYSDLHRSQRWAKTDKRCFQRRPRVCDSSGVA